MVIRTLTLTLMLAMAVFVAFGLSFDLRVSVGGRSVAIFGYVGGDNKVWIGLGASCELLHL